MLCKIRTSIAHAKNWRSDHFTTGNFTFTKLFLAILSSLLIEKTAKIKLFFFISRERFKPGLPMPRTDIQTAAPLGLSPLLWSFYLFYSLKTYSILSKIWTRIVHTKNWRSDHFATGTLTFSLLFVVILSSLLIEKLNYFFTSRERFKLRLPTPSADV